MICFVPLGGYARGWCHYERILYIRCPSRYTVTWCSADCMTLFDPEPLEDGVRSWPTWRSAKSPRNRPQELMHMLETLDSRCWPRLTRLRKPRSSMPKLQTEDLRWWPSSACFSRRGQVTCAYIVFSNSPRQETRTESGWVSGASAQQIQHLWIRKHNLVSSRMVCSEFLKFVSCKLLRYSMLQCYVTRTFTHACH